ncbi:PDZ domain-containing protein [Streptomyces ipomoeae]|jgi:carboxyl-terminal processing protease|uniref:Peptidase, S41 family n=2 Tax=Streptomyces ipomoeae TaxID=103232 RepID=L1KV29_9ACTN|nr:S41 family peptidase [Streptomyces ipomoeae]EKX64497.1 peptidase, S41 family [Streptomyces ipomoeae 91-03]MDX2697281.1 S41 family peptidase [Streptomyces ipomoeae]MDX2824819.1 S41 family peptidase [Streptomyces ipomoeae]MDX2843076.1 S41 family peptidase [Streptomyces ipomoeae]MDX2877411.1 S41 family peptidase [Streptomyces ipomoeae]
MSGPRDLFARPSPTTALSDAVRAVPSDSIRRIRRGAALTLLFAGVLVTGAATGSFDDPYRTVPTATRAPGPTSDEPQQDVADAAAEAMAAGKSPLEAAERAVSRSGDRWGAVYSEGEYEQFEDALDGEYTGVGLWAKRDSDGRIEVDRVQEGSPAASAGIRPGDRLVSIDGHKVDGRPVTEVVSLLRGDTLDDEGGDAGSAGTAEDTAAGTTVSLGLERGTRTWQQTLRRARLSTEDVTVRTLAGGITVVRVDAFTKGSGDMVRAAVEQATDASGFVLDLRGNSGGLVTEAVTTASAFLDGGLVATYDVNGEQRALHADPGGDTARPLVALVDGGTMSAAELLTGALQDRGRAVVVGSRTFGKGSVQMPSRLPDGSVAELTVGHYRTPSGHSVDGRGITPDLEADDDALQRAETVLSGLGQ